MMCVSVFLWVCVCVVTSEDSSGSGLPLGAAAPENLTLTEIDGYSDKYTDEREMEW